MIKEKFTEQNNVLRPYIRSSKRKKASKSLIEHDSEAFCEV